MRAMLRPLTALAAAGALTLTACTSANTEAPTVDGSSTPSAFPTAPASASPTATPAPIVAPVVGECWDQPDTDQWSLAGAPVSCDSPHTGQTVWVG